MRKLGNHVVKTKRLLTSPRLYCVQCSPLARVVCIYNERSAVRGPLVATRAKLNSGLRPAGVSFTPLSAGQTLTVLTPLFIRSRELLLSPRYFYQYPHGRDQHRFGRVPEIIILFCARQKRVSPFPLSRRSALARKRPASGSAAPADAQCDGSRVERARRTRPRPRHPRRRRPDVPRVPPGDGDAPE